MKNDYNTLKTHIIFFHAHSKIQVHDGGAPLSWEISFFAPSLATRLKYFAPTHNCNASKILSPLPPEVLPPNLVNNEPSLSYVLPALPPEEPPIS